MSKMTEQKIYTAEEILHFLDSNQDYADCDMEDRREIQGIILQLQRENGELRKALMEVDLSLRSDGYNVLSVELQNRIKTLIGEP